jgi:hypothetical protein
MSSSGQCQEKVGYGGNFQPPSPRAATRALIRVMAESSAIAPSAFAISRAARASAAASRRLRISFSAFKVSMEASRNVLFAGWRGAGRSHSASIYSLPCPASSRCSAAKACSSVSPTSHPCRSAIA